MGIALQTKTIALVITLSAFAIVLNPTVSKLAIPFFPGTNLSFQFFEIPIIVAFLLLGIKPGLSVAAINAIAMLFIYPGRNFTFPLGNLVAVTAVMLGVYVATELYIRKTHISYLTGNRIILYSTASGILFRVAIMTPVWFAISSFISNIPTPFIVGTLLPLEAIYNTILAMYTVPLAYIISKTINKNLALNNPTSSPDPEPRDEQSPE